MKGAIPVEKIAIIDHGGGDATKKVPYVQMIGDDGISVSQFEQMKIYMTARPVIFLGGCNIGGNTEYCQAIADQTNATVIGANDSVYWHPGLLKQAFGDIPHIEDDGQWIITPPNLAK